MIKIVRAAHGVDWAEYLDVIIAGKTVSDVAQAIGHLSRHGSGHINSLVASDPNAMKQFQDQPGNAIILHSASTQFSDGGEFGIRAEIGVATGHIHARGPVGVEQLTGYKYIVEGDGQTRP